MKRIKTNAALAGVHVRIIQDHVWSASPTLALLRANGGKVSYTDSPAVTHLVTIDAPIEPFKPNDGSLSHQSFLDYVAARTNADKVGAKTCTLEEFRAWIMAKVDQARESETSRIMGSLELSVMPGYVGI